jgi:SAM-dependent methyltransferase
MSKYVHGYSDREAERLQDQSSILEKLLHTGTSYPAGSRVLEAGCGVGAQTVILARRSPMAEIISVDISEDSLAQAREAAARQGLTNVTFHRADILDLPFGAESFDHIFVCFVLEHLVDPLKALVELKKRLKTEGSLTVIEGDHGSCTWYPETPESLKVWDCLVESQFNLGHNPNIGRQLLPLLDMAGLEVADVSPRWVYVDYRHPEGLDGGVNRIIVPMVQTARQQSLEQGLTDEETWERGIRDLMRVADEPGGTFFYTWYKGTARK